MRMLSLLFAASLAAMPLSASAAKIYGPKGGNEAGLELAIVDDSWAEDGLGVGGHYEMVLVPNAGPGHVMGGGTGLFATTDDEDRFGCDRDETIIMGAGRVRYVLGLSPVVKPYVGIGLGLYAISRDLDNCGNPDRDDDDTDIGVGVPISIGLDFAFDNFSFGVSLNIHETNAGDGDDEDFNHVGLGVAWRF